MNFLLKNTANWFFDLKSLSILFHPSWNFETIHYPFLLRPFILFDVSSIAPLLVKMASPTFDTVVEAMSMPCKKRVKTRQAMKPKNSTSNSANSVAILEVLLFLRYLLSRKDCIFLLMAVFLLKQVWLGGLFASFMLILQFYLQTMELPTEVQLCKQS